MVLDAHTFPKTRSAANLLQAAATNCDTQISSSEEGGDDQGYRLVERSYGSFYRSVPLPQGTNPDEIEATMRDGVLTVTLPVPEAARPRRITIQS